MGELAGVKVRTMVRFLGWLERKPGIEIRMGGKHAIVVRHYSWNRPFPLPSHGEVSKHIVRDFVDKLVGSGICTREDAIDRLS